MEYHWALPGKIPGTSLDIVCTETAAMLQRLPSTHYLLLTYLLYEATCIQRTYREDIQTHNAKIALTSMVLKLNHWYNPPENNPPLFLQRTSGFATWSQHKLEFIHSFNKNLLGVPGWLSWLRSDSCSGHDLVVHGFKPHIGLCADSSEPGACFMDSVSPSLRPSPAHSLSLSLSPSKVNKTLKIFF